MKCKFCEQELPEGAEKCPNCGIPGAFWSDAGITVCWVEEHLPYTRTGAAV